MATTYYYLDARTSNRGKQHVLKIAIAHNTKTAYISLNVKLRTTQWDGHRVVSHPDKLVLNAYIQGMKAKVDSFLVNLLYEERLDRMTAHDIKEYVEGELHPDESQSRKKVARFAQRFLSFADSKKPCTREVYLHTYKRLTAFIGEKAVAKLRFEDITKDWLTKFDQFLAQTSPSKNARNIHFRNIRAVFNAAIDDGLTSFYPFRRFKIRPVATAKRNLKVEDLRLLFNYPCEPHAVQYLDIFKLMFMLIGINTIDLCHLKRIDYDGRINYYRAKTNRLYSVKVEPEALAIIKRYRGKKWLLSILDRYANYEDFTRRLNRALKKIGSVERRGLGGKKIYKPLFPQISSYWARHTWATIAASLDVPRDTIAHALGHGGNTVTDIYIDFDQGKVDEANRRVLDWVLYGKK